MQTPWGEIEVHDAHVHFFSHRFFQLLAAQKPGLTIDEHALPGWEIPPVDARHLAENWRAELDRNGVSSAALIASLPGDEDSVVSAVAAEPGRFHGFFMVNPLAPQAIENTVAFLNKGSLRVPCLFPAMHRYSLQAAAPLIEAVAATPHPVVFVHCGVLSVGVRKRLGLQSPFDLRFSNPIDVHGLAMQFPRVRFVLPHFGAGFFREALMVADLCPNVYLDTSSSNSWMKYEGLTLDVVFRRALEVAGAKRLLFGTDSSFFPRGWHRAVFETQVATLARIGAGAEDARAILGGNLMDLLSRPVT